MIWLKGLWTAGHIATWTQRFALYGMLIAIGFAAGTHFTTKTAIDVVQDHADKQFAAVTGGLAKEVNADNKKLTEHLAADAQISRHADDGAVSTLTAAKDQARKQRDMALSELAKMRDARPTPTETVNACPSPVSFTFGAAARGLLNVTSGASPPPANSEGGNPGTNTARDSSGNTAESPTAPR